ncbi:MAG: hypothetical protein SFX73_37070 [Kofleriaceae bacterium]|nr:hypothetical protein [Kofleriaceae bacterium]
MARLGELLVSAGLLTQEQLEQALRAQIMWGARLGTNLVELGFIDLDALSSALARQHSLPAALARHFENVDIELQRALSPQLAEMYSCLPLTRVGPKRQIVIATSSPLTKKAIARIADDLGVDPFSLIPSIAAELRIRYQLERVYSIFRSARFVRSPGKTIPPFPQFVIDDADPESDPDILLEPLLLGATPAAIIPETDVTAPFRAKDAEDDLALEIESVPEPTGDDNDDTIALASPEVLATLDELEPPASETPPIDEASLRERRRYIRTIADELAMDRQIGRIAIRRVAVALDPDQAEGSTLGQATRAIRRAKDRDKVAELAMAALFRFATSCEAAAFLVIRGDAATAWKGFNRSGGPTPELGVPLDQPGLVPRAIANNASQTARASELSPIDQLLLVSLGKASGDLAVVPVSIGGSVMCVLAMVSASDSAIMTAESIAAATGAAFSRLIRDAAR